MTDRQSFDLILPDAEATQRLARHTAGKANSGDLIFLSGPVGAGKTEFARAFIRSVAGADIDVPSPSYALIQPYELGAQNILHVDLYRLADTSEITELGLDDYFGDYTTLIEWPERAGTSLPDPDLHIRLSVLPEGRSATLTAPTSRFLMQDHTADA